MPELSVAFLIDAPKSLAVDADGSWVQVAKQGKFTDPRYGKFAITQDDFTRWLTNFRLMSVAENRAGLPIDVDHGPEKHGNTEAAGWITKLEQRDTELWGFAEWNTLGKQLVGEKRYLYLSPSYHHNYEDEAGKKHGTALVGVGLTNRPFLRMATVSLSTAPPSFAVEEPVEPASDSRPRMADLEKILSKLGLAEDATDEQVDQLIDTLLARPEGQKTLDQLAEENQKVVLDATEYAKTVADATAGAAAAAELKTTKFEAAFTLAMSKGQVTPAEKDDQLAMYEVAPDLTIKTLAARPVNVNVEANGHGGGSNGSDPDVEKDADGDKVDEERLAIHNRALALMVERKIEDYGAAVHLAAAEVGA